MKRIAIITMATALEGEKGPNRFSYLANYLSKNKFEVELITSNFNHWTKQYRNENLKIGKKYKIVYCEQPKYERNIDLKRIYSLFKFSSNIERYLKDNIRNYDLIYCSIPDNFTAKKVCKIAKDNGIPVIIDVEDLWPEGMRLIIDIPLINKILFYPFQNSAEISYSLCDGIIGTSDEYRDRPLKYNKRVILKETVYVGNNLVEFDEGIEKYKNKIKKEKKEYWITYSGTLGASYDIKTLINAIKKLEKEGYDNIKLKILGSGPLLEELKELGGNNQNIEFLGYMEYQEMAAYLSKSDVVVNSFVKKAPQSIVTKIGDYLASGKPMINTCSSIEFKNKVEKDNFGINIEAENVEELEKAILKLYQNKELAQNLGKNARKIAEKEFDREKSYYKIVEMVNSLLGENNEKI